MFFQLLISVVCVLPIIRFSKGASADASSDLPGKQNIGKVNSL